MIVYAILTATKNVKMLTTMLEFVPPTTTSTRLRNVLLSLESSLRLVNSISAAPLRPTKLPTEIYFVLVTNRLVSRTNKHN